MQKGRPHNIYVHPLTPLGTLISPLLTKPERERSLEQGENSSWWKERVVLIKNLERKKESTSNFAYTRKLGKWECSFNPIEFSLNLMLKLCDET